MRKFSFFAIAALILAGFGGWIASTSQARVAAPIAGVSINPTQLTMTSGDLPTEYFVDYSFVYH
jgi:hypothetical protein